MHSAVPLHHVFSHKFLAILIFQKMLSKFMRCGNVNGASVNIGGSVNLLRGLVPMSPLGLVALIRAIVAFCKLIACPRSNRV